MIDPSHEWCSFMTRPVGLADGGTGFDVTEIETFVTEAEAKAAADRNVFMYGNGGYGRASAILGAGRIIEAD